ncbi:MAG: amino acid adenylation domain-containing protein [Tepidisphaeraceae bacterium]
MSQTQALNLAWPLFCHAQNNPARTALGVEGRHISYGELAAAAARVANWLRSRGGAGAAPRVGILAARSFEAYAGILGVAWAGGTYIPLNPRMPASRLASALQQAGAGGLIVDRRGTAALKELGPAAPASVLIGDDARAESPDLPGTAWSEMPSPANAPPPAAVAADHPAYLIFTSGTTGAPKGVILTAAGVASFLASVRSIYALGPADRVAQFIELTFDPSVMELFGCWDGGASLHVIPETKLMAPGGFLREHEITFFAAVPSLIAVMQRMKQLQPGALPALRVSIFGGEGFSVELAHVWQAAAPNSVVDNQYGPTEATVCCMQQRLTEPPIETPGRGTLAIGKPYPGIEAGIIGPELNFLLPGQTGELAIAGPQLAIGYIGDDVMTARRFPTLDHPRLGRTRWYLTGDLAMCDQRGIFHCYGRVDHQVKVLGHRVELEEVEAHLRAVCSTNEVAAVAWPVVNGSAAGIVGFVCGSQLAPATVREAMKQRVPAYMVPGKLLALDMLPLSSNGKVDRHALRALLDKGFDQSLDRVLESGVATS